MKNKKGLIIAICAVIAACAVLAVVYQLAGPKVQSGTKAYTLEVVDDKENVKTYTGKTDAEFLSELMDELTRQGEFTYAGTQGPYGLYIEGVNGLIADYDADGAYWSIYVNGEYGMYGADIQPVTDGDSFALKYEGSNGN
ncbi:MAG: DUF4430 domain-containing protein [Lachnospiraceae bacterium]|nr:DUF4430 domain-containing protein [Lachnospiraceae bacterium]